MVITDYTARNSTSTLGFLKYLKYEYGWKYVCVQLTQKPKWERNRDSGI